MAEITNLIPIRVDAMSSDGAVRVIETILVDKTCLPVSGAWPGISDDDMNDVVQSLSSLIDANAAYFAESILADAEVYGTVRLSKNYLGGRLDLLTDLKLYQKVQNQIQTQLAVALSVEKEKLICKGGPLSSIDSGGEKGSPGVVTSSGDQPIPDGAVSSGENTQTISTKLGESSITNNSSKIIRIKLRIRHETIAMVDEFDYDINSSGLEGSCPLSLANSIVVDLKLPPEFAPSIATSIVEQIYGVDVLQSLDDLDSEIAKKGIPAAFVLDTKNGTNTGFAQMILDSTFT